MGITVDALKVLVGRRGLTLGDVAGRLSRHPSTVYLTLERARLEGCLTRKKGRSRLDNRMRYVYKITPYGERKLRWLTRRKR